MTAKEQRANQEHEAEPRNGTADGEQPENSEAARAEANAKAAAEEAARLTEAESGEAEGQETAEEDPMTALRNEVDDLKERLQRAVAETENVRRRAERERQDAVKYAASPLAKDLLGVADNLRRALDSVPKEAAEQDANTRNLLAGVEMTEKELADTLAKHGIQRVKADPGDRFDPHRHEAMYEVPTDEQAPGSIVHVVQNGYMLHDRLLRPARVGVARAANGGGVDTKA
jgi:molecular chaperone GrpE